MMSTKMREKEYLVILPNKPQNTLRPNLFRQIIRILLLMLAACSYGHLWLDAQQIPRQPATTLVSHRDNNTHHIRSANHVYGNYSLSRSPSTPPSSSKQLLDQQSVLGGFCNGYSSCKSQQTTQSSNTKRFSNCKCDPDCGFYGDCCSNATTTSGITFSQRINSTDSSNDKSSRKEWHCYKVNHSSGNILIKAKCPNDWLARNNFSQAAKLTQKNCEFAKFINNNQQDDHLLHDQVDEWETNIEPQKDPMGMMIPITELETRITFANSHCLLCNRKELKSMLSKKTWPNNEQTSNKQQHAAAEQVSSREAIYNDNKPLQPKLIYWTPSLECNYLENDERNAIYDLIKANKGQALEYSSARKRWIIKRNVTSEQTETTTASINKNISDQNDSSVVADNQADNQDQERVCSITPIVPDLVDNTLRFCEPNTIDTCKPYSSQQQANNLISLEEYNRAKLECDYGYQAVVYSVDSGQSYLNLGCAKCNHEKRISCYPKLVFAMNKHVIVNDNNPPNGMYSPPNPATGGAVEPPTIITNQQQDPNKATSGLARTIHPGGSLVSASISILFDIYPSSHGDVEVGFFYQCPEDQIFDSFYSKCVDAWNCGPNRKLIDDECKEIDNNTSTSTDYDATTTTTATSTTVSSSSSALTAAKETNGGLKWVPKFNFTMANLTAVGLMVSIISLSIYLCLFVLSTFDLRPLVAAYSNVNQSPPLDRIRLSRESDSYSTKSVHIGDKSQNLASRGVACLAASLLAAYILFILGHRQQASSSSGSWNENERSLKIESSTPITVQPSLSCFFMAIGTYYFFLVSFNWMFLLSYDIWRILRLATRQLQKPSTKTQSTRFMIYAVLALFSAAIFVSIAIMFDLIPINCQQQQQPSFEASTNCNTNDKLIQFIHDYRPRFGYRLNSCWFTNRRALAIFFALPVSLIMFVNLVFFVHSSFMVIKSSTKPTSKKKNKNKNNVSHSSKVPSTASSLNSTSNPFKWFTTGLSSKKAKDDDNEGDNESANNKFNKQQDQSKKTDPKGTIMARINSLTTISLSSNDEDHQQQHQHSSNHHDYTNQNELTTSSFTSVQTLQSHISASSSSASSTTSAEDFPCSAGLGSESPQLLLQYSHSSSYGGLPEGAPKLIKITEENSDEQCKVTCTNNPVVCQSFDKNRYKRSSPPPLESTQSSNSLTNQSVSGVSITASLAMKYDTSKQNISLVMNSIGKDYRLYMRLSTIMGLTWFFGLIATIVDQSYLLWYLFIILNTLQGLFIFIAFGCRKSKLANVQILINYIQFKLLEIKTKCCYSTLNKNAATKTEKTVFDSQKPQQQALKQTNDLSSKK